MEPLKVPRGFTTLTKALGEPTMLERMWEPTLGHDKMAWVRRHTKQKVQLFEDQMKAKTPCFRAWKGSERLSEAQLAPKGTFKACSQDATFETPKCSGFGVILYWLTPEGSSRQAWSAGATVSC